MAVKKTYKIHIIKIDSSTFQLTKISSGVLYKVSEKFKFLPDAYKFLPAYRLRGINGVSVRLVRADGTFPSGLFSEIVEYLTDTLKKQVTMSSDVQEHYLPLNDFFPDGIKDDVFSDFEFDGNPVILRDYQLGAVQSAFENRNGVLNLSTGAGKCLGAKTRLKVKLPRELIKKYKHLL